MKKSFFLTAILCAVVPFVHAQSASQIVNRGIALHDQGEYDQALLRYDSAISLYPGYYNGYYEKAYTLTAQGKYNESIRIIEATLAKFPDHAENGNLYSNYGDCYDYLKMPEKALEIYDQGIRKYPSTAILHFNKGVALAGMDRKADASEEMVRSIRLNKSHKSSHFRLAQYQLEDNKVFSILANCFFLTLQATGDRGVQSLEDLETAMASNVKRTGENTISINMSPKKDNGKPGPNEFREAEIMLSMGSALNHDDKYANETRQQRVQRNLGDLFAFFAERPKGTGLAWDFYVPFFIALKKSEHFETWTHYIVFSSETDPKNSWLSKNLGKMDGLAEWIDKYFGEKE